MNQRGQKYSLMSHSGFVFWLILGLSSCFLGAVVSGHAEGQNPQLFVQVEGEFARSVHALTTVEVSDVSLQGAKRIKVGVPTSFQLPEGQYLIKVSFHGSECRGELELETDQPSTFECELQLGQLNARAVFKESGAAVTFPIRWDLMPMQDMKGYSTWSIGSSFTSMLTPGEYQLVAQFGMQRVVKQFAIQVQEEHNLEFIFQLGSCNIELKKDGEPLDSLAKVSVFVADSPDLPIFTEFIHRLKFELPEGDYLAKIEYEEKVYHHPFNIREAEFTLYSVDLESGEIIENRFEPLT